MCLIPYLYLEKLHWRGRITVWLILFNGIRLNQTVKYLFLYTESKPVKSKVTLWWLFSALFLYMFDSRSLCARQQQPLMTLKQLTIYERPYLKWLESGRQFLKSFLGHKCLHAWVSWHFAQLQKYASSNVETDQASVECKSAKYT